MRISQKLDYASRAMVHLAKKHDGQSVVRADDIAEGEGIPSSFLAQILHELKRTGLVTSRRGKTGGWKLIESPANISLLQIVEALEPEALGQIPQPSGESGVAVGKLWESVRESSRQILAKNSLETLAAEDEPMFYI
ncbi:Rrf2 family transcriptional regulator [bacterium]|nr:Rrf2 family transcriptional regulator [Akkermansiaceae bacterium]MDA7887089.1 Rrf2 family transcriptional regulator [bacterium]MDB4370293.1 Rrf2 family transcriptional regulator [Akkermansiaceae bacterium]MDB4422540.1 Rrf2 family transcriptional regulator [bacterium]MDB4465090.1 Rrf2 family transcriptional regulator [Akkermansiaceae bacterium]